MNDFAKLSKKELLRYAGQTSQIAGVSRFTFADGMARGLPAVQVKNGSGLAFTVTQGQIKVTRRNSPGDFCFCVLNENSVYLTVYTVKACDYWK